jgi:hypothetical protein
MSDAVPTVPSVSWRQRAVRRVAWTIGGVVAVSGVAPALANAAGADVTNPVAIALRASGRGLQSALGGEETTATVACETPSAEPSVVPTETVSAEPTETVPVETATVEESAEPSVEPSAEPSVDPSDEPVETAVPTESVAPTETESAAPTAAPEDCVTPEPVEATPTPSATPETEAPEAEDAHGAIVSTVAKCAPKGKDPLLDAEGAPANHGGYVKVAAHGDSLTTPWGTFDLSTQAGADALCAALDAARAELPAVEKQHGKKADKPAKKAKPAKAAKAAKAKGAKGGNAGKGKRGK